MRLLLIRHGQTPSNVLGALDTRVPGPGLTDLGCQQAAAVPHALAEERIGAIFASVQRRAQLTAAPLADARGLPIVVRDGLREISAGDLEMKSDRASVTVYHHVSFSWPAGELEVRMPGGENGVEALGRFDSVVREAHQTGHETVAFVAHGADHPYLGGRARGERRRGVRRHEHAAQHRRCGGGGHPGRRVDRTHLERGRPGRADGRRTKQRHRPGRRGILSPSDARAA